MRACLESRRAGRLCAQRSNRRASFRIRGARDCPRHKAERDKPDIVREVNQPVARARRLFCQLAAADLVGGEHTAGPLRRQQPRLRIVRRCAGRRHGVAKAGAGLSHENLCLDEYAKSSLRNESSGRPPHLAWQAQYRRSKKPSSTVSGGERARSRWRARRRCSTHPQRANIVYFSRGAAQLWPGAAFMASKTNRRGVFPKVRLNAAVKALSEAYPTSAAVSAIVAPSRSRRLAAHSMRHKVM